MAEKPQGKQYRGFRDKGDEPVVMADDEPLTPDASQNLQKLSNYGFEWGFDGVGPAQLALALLLDATGSEPLARRLYMKFKRDHVCRFAKRTWLITQDEIVTWVGINA